MKNTTLQQSHVGKYLKLKVNPLIVTKKKFFTLWDVKFLVTLPILERLKQSFVSGLIIVKVNIF